MSALQRATQNLELSTVRIKVSNGAVEFGKVVSAMLSLSSGVAFWKEMSKKPTVWL